MMNMELKHVFRRISFYSVLSVSVAIWLSSLAKDEARVSGFFNGAIAIVHMSPIASLYLSTITFSFLKRIHFKQNLFAFIAPIPFFIICVICVEYYYSSSLYLLKADLFTVRTPVWIITLLLSCVASLLLYRFYLRFIADR